jgi:hypothetical protein
MEPHLVARPFRPKQPHPPPEARSSASLCQLQLPRDYRKGLPSACLSQMPHSHPQLVTRPTISPRRSLAIGVVNPATRLGSVPGRIDVRALTANEREELMQDLLATKDVVKDESLAVVEEATEEEEEKEEEARPAGFAHRDR